VYHQPREPAQVDDEETDRIELSGDSCWIFFTPN
jgi:hypothetical protein